MEKELKVKREIETRVDRGVAEQGISFFIILKLQRGEYIALFLYRSSKDRSDVSARYSRC
jgi:hypothetical protein